MSTAVVSLVMREVSLLVRLTGLGATNAAASFSRDKDTDFSEDSFDPRERRLLLFLGRGFGFGLSDMM